MSKREKKNLNIMEQVLREKEEGERRGCIYLIRISGLENTRQKAELKASPSHFAIASRSLGFLVKDCRGCWGGIML